MSWKFLDVVLLYILFATTYSQQIDSFHFFNTSEQLTHSGNITNRDSLAYWGQLVRDGKFDDVAEILRQEPGQLNNIVRTAYDGSDLSGKKLIDFSNKLSKDQRKVIYETLFSEPLISFKIILRLAFKAKQLLDAAAGNQAIQTIWNELPETLRAIVSGEEVLLKNEGYPSWYYMVVSRKYDNDRDTVLATKNIFDEMLTFKWQFAPIHDGQSFLIKTYYKSLYVADNYFALNEDDRRVFMWKKGYPENPGEWEILDHDWKNGLYKFYNHHFNAFLGVREKRADIDTDHLAETDFSIPTSSKLVYTNRKNTTERPIIWKVEVPNILMVKDSNSGATLSECIQNFLDGNFRVSVDKFMELGDPLLIKDVVKAVYEKSKISKIFDYLSQFLWNLGSKSKQQLILNACDVLLLEMQASDGDELGVFLVDKLLKKLSETVNVAKYSEHYRRLHETVARLIPAAIKKWVDLTSMRDRIGYEMFDKRPGIKNENVFPLVQINNGSDTNSLISMRISSNLTPGLSAQVSIELNKMIDSSRKTTFPLAKQLDHTFKNSTP